jgi:hypothetical protein
MLSLTLYVLSLLSCETVGPRLDGTTVTICAGHVASVQYVGPTWAAEPTAFVDQIDNGVALLLGADGSELGTVAARPDWKEGQWVSCQGCERACGVQP